MLVLHRNVLLGCYCPLTGRNEPQIGYGNRFDPIHSTEYRLINYKGVALFFRLSFLDACSLLESLTGFVSGVSKTRSISSSERPLNSGKKKYVKTMAARSMTMNTKYI